MGYFLKSVMDKMKNRNDYISAVSASTGSAMTPGEMKKITPDDVRRNAPNVQRAANMIAQRRQKDQGGNISQYFK